MLPFLDATLPGKHLPKTQLLHNDTMQELDTCLDLQGLITDIIYTRCLKKMSEWLFVQPPRKHNIVYGSMSV